MMDYGQSKKTPLLYIEARNSLKTVVIYGTEKEY